MHFRSPTPFISSPGTKKSKPKCRVPGDMTGACTGKGAGHTRDTFGLVTSVTRSDAGVCRRVQRRPSIFSLHIRVGSGIQQRLDDRKGCCVGVYRQVQRSLSEFSLRIRIGSCVQQRLNDRKGCVGGCRPVQGSLCVFSFAPPGRLRPSGSETHLSRWRLRRMRSCSNQSTTTVQSQALRLQGTVRRTGKLPLSVHIPSSLPSQCHHLALKPSGKGNGLA